MSDNIFYFPILKFIHQMKKNDQYHYYTLDIKNSNYHSLTNAMKILTDSNLLRRANSYVILELELLNPQDKNDKEFIPKFKILDAIDGAKAKTCASLF